MSRTTGSDPAGPGQDDDALVRAIALAESSDLEVAADRLRAVVPVAAAYVDTSISFVRGPGGDTEIADRIARFLRCPTVTTSTAVRDACSALDVSRLAVLSIYDEGINARIPAFFAPRGVDIVRIMNVEHGAKASTLGRMDPNQLFDAGRDINGPDVDAVFVPCTAVRTLEAIEPLEAELGKPVITAIQATMWRVAQLAGIAATPVGGGRLFREG